MSKDLNALADSAFNDLATSLPGAGVHAQQAFAAFSKHRQALSLGVGDAETALTAINEEPAWEPGKAERTQINLDIFDSVHKASVAGMQTALTELRDRLETAATADLVPSTDSTARLLLRQDIDALVGPNPDVMSLLRVARDPRFTAEIASGYGQTLLARAGMADRAPEIVRGILKTVPGSTPQARAARLALDKLDKAVGHVAGLAHVARQKVDATQPRQRAGYAGNVIANRLVK